jgi:integrase
VRTILRAAFELGTIERLPDLPKLPRQSKKMPDAPTTEEVQVMLANAKGWLRIAIALSAFGGLRMGEVSAIEVRDIDLDHDLPFVRRALSSDEVMSPKSGDERVVPLTTELRLILTEAIRRKLPTARSHQRAREDARDQHVLTVIKALQARHGLKERSFPSLRHYFCSVLIRHGASVEAVRMLAGHSKLDITQRHVHANAADLTAAIAKLSGQLVGNGVWSDFLSPCF